MIRPKIKRFWQNKKGSIAIVIGNWLIISTMQWLGWFQWLEWAALDRLFQTRPNEPLDERIVIVGVTEADIRKYQEYPFSDELLAELLEKIKAQSPKVIGLDLFRDIAVGSGKERLEAIFKSTPNLIGIGSAEGYKDDTYFTKIDFPPVLYELSKKNNFQLNKIQVSDVGLFVDDDGVVRRGIVFPSEDPESLGYNIPSLGAVVAFRYLNIEPSVSENRDRMRLGKKVFHAFRSNDGGYVGAVDSGLQIIINWRGPAESFKHVSVAEVMEGRVATNLFRERIVLIGATAPTLSRDAHNTPFSEGQGETPKPTYGVEIQANIASQILSAVLDNRPLVQTWSQSQESIWIFAWTLPIAIVGWVYRSHPIFKLSGIIFGSTVVLTVILIGTVYVAFEKSYWIPVVPPLLSLGGTMLGIVGYTYVERIKEVNARLEETNATLEIQVDARTLELNQKNQELEQTLQELRQAQERLIAIQRLVILGQSVAGLNHEFKNLVGPIANNVEISQLLCRKLNELQIDNLLTIEAKVQKQEKLLKQLEKQLETVANYSQRGKQLTLQLLPINFKNSLTQPLIPVEVNSLIKSVCFWIKTSRETELLRKNFQLEENYDLSLTTIQAVPSDLNFVVSSLLNNAWDALLERQKRREERFVPTIRLKTQNFSDKIQIIVRDNGIGVSESISDSIFEHFFTTKLPGKGTGLGLSLARDLIVGRYQGAIRFQTVDTAEGKETAFIVELSKSLEKMTQE
jgi:adenylate cyclase